jgi:hypothetical protein
VARILRQSTNLADSFFVLIGTLFIGHSLYQDMSASNQNLCVVNTVAVPLFVYFHLLVVSSALVLLVNDGLKWLFIKSTKKIAKSFSDMLPVLIGFGGLFFLLIIFEPTVCAYIEAWNESLQFIFGSAILVSSAFVGNRYIKLAKKICK